jgi:hypothetical protein
MWRFFSFGWLEVYFCPLSLASLTWGFSPTFWVAELPLLIGQLKLHVHVFFMINSNFEMVESVSFHGTHCPFWLSALHYAQGMWPQAFRYISPAATSWPQRVSRSSARRMLPSDSQRWVEHVGTISRRYVKTNSSEMYKRKRKDWKVKNHHIYKTISIETSFPIYGWVLPRVSAVSHGFPMDSQEWNGPFTQPSAYCSRLTARYMWTAWVMAWLRCASGRRWIPTATSTSRMGSFETCLDLVWKMENDGWFSLYSEFNLRISCGESILFVRWCMWFIVFCQLSKVLNCWGRNERDAPWNTSHS